MPPERRIPIALPSVGEEEWQALRAPLDRGWLTQGPEVQAFEREFADRHQVGHAVATSNCTTALHLILLALGVGPGDEVLLPAFTWVASANAVLYCGATPVFVDVDPATFNIEPAQVAARVTSKTRALMAVHLFGLCADIDALAAAAPGIPILEDAACAVGAGYKGRSAGALGVAAAFSFHPRKVLTTGEGGMVTTNDAALAREVARLRSHGAGVSEEERHTGPRPYLLPEFEVLGFNYRMTDLQAALGRVQLRKLDRFIEEREAWAEHYRRELAPLTWLATPAAPAGYRHSWQAFVCRLDEARAPLPRNDLMQSLHENGVATRPGTHAVHTLGLYRRRGLRPEDYPAARAAELGTLTLPLHNRMSPDDYGYVVEQLRRIG